RANLSLVAAIEVRAHDLAIVRRAGAPITGTSIVVAGASPHFLWTTVDAARTSLGARHGKVDLSRGDDPAAVHVHDLAGGASRVPNLDRSRVDCREELGSGLPEARRARCDQPIDPCEPVDEQRRRPAVL